MKIVHVINAIYKSGKSLVHMHTVTEYILAVEGRGEIVLEGIGNFKFEKGTVICVPPNTVHYNITDDHYEHLCILIDAEPLLPRDKLVFFDDSNGTCEKIWSLAMDVYFGSGSGREEMLEALAYAASVAIRERSQTKESENVEVKKVMSIMAEHLTDPEFSVSDAMRDISYSPAYFRKLFNGQTGHSPVGYLSYLRIQNAMRLLKFDKLTVSATAEMSGFLDVRYFCRVFKKQTGKTPSEYAKSFK